MIKFNYENLHNCFNNINDFYKEYYDSDDYKQKYCDLLQLMNKLLNQTTLVFDLDIKDIHNQNIFKIIYDKPPDKITTNDKIKDLLSKLNILTLNNTMSTTTNTLISDEDKFLSFGLNQIKVDEKYIISKDYLSISNYNGLITEDNKKAIYNYITKLLDTNGVYNHKDKVIKYIRDCQQHLQGIYLGYGYYKNETITNEDSDVFIKGRDKCLIFGDIHGDIFPIIEIFKKNEIVFDKINDYDIIINDYDIIFLGDVYDPFNNEFILRSTKDRSDKFKEISDFNNNLVKFANDDLYLTIVFVLFLAYKGARVYWILGNHDINSCALNPFFYAIMNLLVNDVDEISNRITGKPNDKCESDGLIDKIQKNLFICQKLFYTYDTNNFLLEHESANIYDKINDKSCDLINYGSILNERKYKINYDQTYNSTEINYVNDKICKVSNLNTYNSAVTNESINRTHMNVFSNLGLKMSSVNKIYGHTYEYDKIFYDMFFGNPMEIKNIIPLYKKKINISLDHTTSFYKSTASACGSGIYNNVTMNFESMGSYEGETNLNLESFLKNNNSFPGNLFDNTNVFIIKDTKTGHTKLNYSWNITKNTQNKLVILTDIQYCLKYDNFKNQYINFDDEELYDIFVTNTHAVNITISKDSDKLNINDDKINIKTNIKLTIDTNYNNVINYLKKYLEFYKGYYKKDNIDITGSIERLLTVYDFLFEVKNFKNLDDTNKEEKTYNDFRNNMFIVNKHKLINGCKITEENLGRIFFVHGKEKKLNLESIELNKCYKKKMECINKYQGQYGGLKPSISNTNDSDKDQLQQSISFYNDKLENKSNIDIFDLFSYLDKNPFIKKKLCEKFYYELVYYSINDDDLFKPLYKKYITDYLYKYVYDVDNLSKYEYIKLNRDNFDTKKYLNNILKLYNFLDTNTSNHKVSLITSEFSPISFPSLDLHTRQIDDRSHIDSTRRKIIDMDDSSRMTKNKFIDNFNRGIAGGGKPLNFNIEDAIQFIRHHSLYCAWETEFFIIDIIKNEPDNYNIILNKDYEKYIKQIQEFISEFIRSLDLSVLLKDFVFNSIKTCNTIQEINMIIVYIQYYLHQNELYIDKQFALNIFYNVLKQLCNDGRINISMQDTDGDFEL